MTQELTLLQKQQLFPKLLVKLFQYAESEGFDITLGEAWRPDETAKIDAQEGKGISNSLHRLRLAIDLNVFRAGILGVSCEDFKELGTFWETLSSDGYQCAWGGRFTHVDADHFSIAHGGVK